jgi:hypothetical protein
MSTHASDRFSMQDNKSTHGDRLWRRKIFNIGYGHRAGNLSKVDRNCGYS